MKKSLALAVVLPVIVSAACTPLAARDRRGSTVELNLTDGRRIKGELLAVKGHDLIIHDATRDTGFSVAIEMVSAVRLKRRSKVLSGLGVGFIAGMGAGVAMARSRRDGDLGEQAGAALTGLKCWGAVTIIGGLIGAVLSRPEEIATNGGGPVQIKAFLRHLQKHARY